MHHQSTGILVEGSGGKRPLDFAPVNKCAEVHIQQPRKADRFGFVESWLVSDHRIQQLSVVEVSKVI